MLAEASRRQFLRGVSSLAVAGAAPSLSAYLSAMASASAQTAGDYKALVCIYLSGGNDHINTIVPFDTASYNAYYAARGGVGLAFSQSQLLPGPSQGALQVAFNPNLPNIAALSAAKQATVVANVGPLIGPITKSQYAPNSALLPPLLASHIDQQKTWQSLGHANPQGWGGLLGDALSSGNGATVAPFTTVSANGETILFLTGTETSQYVVSGQGVPSAFFAAGSPFANALLHSTMSANLLEQAVGGVYQDLQDYAGELDKALPPVKSFPTLPANNGLAQELLTVARIIKIAPSSLGARRQIFYVNFGGFDTHDQQSTRHPPLMKQLDDAVNYFHQIMASAGLWSNVTLFTMSEFGRQLLPNNGGTDHGWGSHHLVMGGAVAGGIVGQLPTIGVVGPNFLQNGWMIPTTSVEQYGMALGSWMGVGASDLARIFPNVATYSETPVKLFF